LIAESMRRGESRPSQPATMYPNLKLQLWRMGIRQNRLAQLLGIDESMLSRIVNGFREPSPSVRAEIAVILKSDEGWLFEAAEPVGELCANCRRLTYR
jgi:transcriptional regulator with XRE-family HTH domain